MLLTATSLHHLASAQSYPSKPITIVVPYAAGGNLDVTTRVVAQAMSKSLGQPLIVDNRAGAGGLIGHGYVAKAEPDGYTLLTTANGSFAFAPKLAPGAHFSPRDFSYVGMMSSTPLVLAVPEGSPFKTFQEFTAYAKANPGKVSIGHPGNGTTNHIAILQLQEALQAAFTIVAYKGSAPALSDLLGSQIDAMVDQLPSSLPSLKTKKLRALAVTTSQPVPDLPNVPTLEEAGLKGFEVITASGLLAPAKTPAAVVETLNAALNRALADPEVNKRLANLGASPKPGTSRQFESFLLQEDEKASRLAEQGLLKAE